VVTDPRDSTHHVGNGCSMDVVFNYCGTCSQSGCVISLQLGVLLHNVDIQDCDCGANTVLLLSVTVTTM